MSSYMKYVPDQQAIRNYLKRSEKGDQDDVLKTTKDVSIKADKKRKSVSSSSSKGRSNIKKRALKKISKPKRKTLKVKKVKVTPPWL